jgi:hypothetical protein
MTRTERDARRVVRALWGRPLDDDVVRMVRTLQAGEGLERVAVAVSTA